MATIFDKVLSGEIPALKVWEDDHFFAFLDINPRCEGHTLVIPKAPSDYLFDLDDAALGELMVATKTVANLLKQKLGCERVCVGAWGFEVKHVHIHLFPANTIDDAPPPAANDAAKASLEATHAKIIA